MQTGWLALCNLQADRRFTNRLIHECRQLKDLLGFVSNTFFALAFQGEESVVALEWILLYFCASISGHALPCPAPQHPHPLIDHFMASMVSPTEGENITANVGVPAMPEISG